MSIFHEFEGEPVTVKEGDFIKVLATGEGFWMQVLGVDGVHLTAQVIAGLFCTDLHGIKYPDVVRLETRHVKQAISAEEQRRQQTEFLQEHHGLH